MGYSVRGLTRGLTTLSNGYQELLVVTISQDGKPPGELRLSKSVEYDIFAFSALTL